MLIAVASVTFTFHNVSINSSTLPETAHLIDLFTFHNVSINSKLHPQNVRKKYDLHSIMYLLIRKTGDTVNAKDLFTFHNVSINSPVAAYSLPLLLHLHSIMYLLIPQRSHPVSRSSNDLHSIMYLLIPKAFSVWICISLFTFHNVSINSHPDNHNQDNYQYLHSIMYLLILTL